ncbi:MAG: FtsW/RodA/SpoVE family cell cycle protein [Patescibacteria group bacterium]
MFNPSKIFNSTDWLLLGSAVFISLAGILTMKSFLPEGLGGEVDRFFYRQIVWLIVAVLVFICASNIDWRFMRRTGVLVSVFLFSLFILVVLLGVAPIKGARSWFDLGLFAFQPVDFIKLVLVFILAKYFGRRHIEIANVRHILVSGMYSMILFLLIILQPDFGSAIIIFLIWLGMILVSGVSKKHLFAVIAGGTIAFCFLWFFVFADYQKARITSFINPLADLHGAGYNANQSMIAVGSGQLFGKGIGMGSQSKLKFLPEYETDFIFAAFGEEWGFIGFLVLFGLYGVLFWRIFEISKKGSSNFEALFGMGLGIILFSHFVIHTGMNIGLLPVTGITMPLMSYGGSHLLAEFLGLGILVGMSNYSRAVHKDTIKNEMVGMV